MTLHRPSLAFGVAFCLAGLAFLVEVTGAWTVELADLLPILLIAAGAALLLPAGRRAGPAVEKPTALAVERGTARRATVRLHHGAGRLHVRAGAPAGQLLALSSSTPVQQQVRHGAEAVEVDLSARPGSWVGQAAPITWELALAEDVELELVVRTGAAQVVMELAALPVRVLDLATGASDVDIALPAHGTCRAKVSAGAADVRLRVPQGVGAAIRDRSALAGFRVDESRFPRDGSGYRSPGFADARDRVEIDVEGGVASFSVT
jgi:hypothetical protein